MNLLLGMILGLLLCSIAVLAVWGRVANPR